MDGHGTSPKGRCEEIPDPSEVSSLGKLRVFLISYNLINRNDTIADLETCHCLDISLCREYITPKCG